MCVVLQNCNNDDDKSVCYVVFISSYDKKDFKIKLLRKAHRGSALYFKFKVFGGNNKKEE